MTLVAKHLVALWWVPPRPVALFKPTLLLWTPGSPGLLTAWVELTDQTAFPC